MTHEPTNPDRTVAQLIDAAGDLLDPATDDLPSSEIRRRIARFHRLRAAVRDTQLHHQPHDPDPKQP